MRLASAYLLGIVILVTAVVHPVSSGAQSRSAGFSMYTHAFLDTDRRSSVLVNISVPHTSLIFLKKGGQFQSEYAVYLKILNKKKKLIQTAVLDESVIAENYEATRSAKLNSKSSKRVHLDQGDYIVQCVVQVKNTNRVFKKESEVTVPEFLVSGIGIGKPRLFAAEIDTSRYAPVFIRVGSDEGLGYEEKESTIFAELDRQPVLWFDVYLEEESSDSVECILFFEVVDGQESQRAYGRKDVRVSGLRSQFIVALNVDDWDPGSYDFNVKAIQEDPLRETTSNLKFMVGYTRAMLVKHWDKTLTLLSLIATKDELEELKTATADERLRSWAKFWIRRDPSPGTDENEALEEHLIRVRHATEQFTVSEPGWNTDRGKVYIKFGEPDHTEVKMDTEYQGEYLIWYYYKQNQTFIFYDRFGLGEYILSDKSLL